MISQNQTKGNQRFVGLASVFLQIDRVGDVLLPGAFGNALELFLKNGFITWGHGWDSPPIAFPIFAAEVPSGLKIVGEFHSTEAAQAIQTVVTERFGQQMSCPLSIGFRPDPASIKRFSNGQEMVKYLLKNQLASPKQISKISAWQKPCRLITKVLELFEVSLVAVPMNPGSQLLQTPSTFPNESKTSNND